MIVNVALQLTDPTGFAPEGEMTTVRYTPTGSHIAIDVVVSSESAASFGRSSAPKKDEKAGNAQEGRTNDGKGGGSTNNTNGNPMAAPPGKGTSGVGGAVPRIEDLPAYVGEALDKAGVQRKYVKESVVEYFSELDKVPVPGHGDQTYNTIPGVFYKNTIVLATEPTYWKDQSSKNLAFHEIGNAFDFAMGYISRRQDFQQAWGNDNSRLPLAYYRNRPGEAYAETFARYYSRDKTLKKDWPQLYEYVRGFDNCKKGGFSGC